MQLNIRPSGNGDKTAVLLHGFNCDAGEWFRFAPELTKRGYRVLAADLRGHGFSARAPDYTAAAFAQDLLDTFPAGADLMVGHSLGASLLGHVVGELRPGKAIYLDPPWRMPGERPIKSEDRSAYFPDLSKVSSMTREELRKNQLRMFPEWTADFLEADLDSWANWDPATQQVIEDAAIHQMPETAAAPSLVIAADLNPACTPAAQDALRKKGFEVRVAAGLTHALQRDNFDVFMKTVQDWI
jgi:pimeloyl-ACP methyl ester carboxylesterase